VTFHHRIQIPSHVAIGARECAGGHFLADAAVLVMCLGHVELGLREFLQGLHDAVDRAADLAQLVLRMAVHELRDVALREPFGARLDGLQRTQHRKEHPAEEIEDDKEDAACAVDCFAGAQCGRQGGRPLVGL
jgi:hypothetical protein